MTSDTREGAGVSTTPAPAGEPDPAKKYNKANPLKIGVGLVGAIVVIWAMLQVFLSFKFYPEIFLDSKLVIGVVAVLVGVGGAAGFFHFLNMAVEGLPLRASLKVMPYAYLLPGFSLIVLMLLYPTVQTITYSFADADSEAWVGFQNYTDIFGSDAFWQSITNNVLWLIVVPAFTVAFGVIVAVLADKLSPNGEKVSKSLIFLPMAISFVGASTIWRELIYAYQDPSREQTGALNAFWTAIGGSPQTWLNISDGRLNSFLLMVILIWLQVGFGMILLSSAIKGVPEDTIEAARIDGASELAIFFRVVLPQIKGTMITVFITVTIMVLKVFDIVYVLTNGRFETNVIANLFYNEAFANGQNGRAAAIVVVLLIAVMPVLIYQVRHFRAEEANR